MNREHLHAESARGLNGSRDGVRDVVELQIEPDLCAGWPKPRAQSRGLRLCKVGARF